MLSDSAAFGPRDRGQGRVGGFDDKITKVELDLGHGSQPDGAVELHGQARGVLDRRLDAIGKAVDRQQRQGQHGANRQHHQQQCQKRKE